MRIRVAYTGRVQGVGFRATAQFLARERAVTGWVRNEPDGAVLLEAQGEEGEVRALLDQISRTMARNIESASQTALDDLSGESSFHITR